MKKILILTSLFFSSYVQSNEPSLNINEVEAMFLNHDKNLNVLAYSSNITNNGEVFQQVAIRNRDLDRGISLAYTVYEKNKNNEKTEYYKFENFANCKTYSMLSTRTNYNEKGDFLFKDNQINKLASGHDIDFIKRGCLNRKLKIE